MPRISSAVPRHKRVKRTMKAARGARMTRSTTFHAANETLLRAGNYARAGRRLKKRDYRGIWIVRVSAACMAEGILYSRLINGMKKAGITLNRKMLSEIALHDPQAFSAVVRVVKEKMAATA
ncbi:MAG: 50S ribosomal protein L20 [Phycisphaerae bacterium]|jgi:large subunit ribosomal protein L20|nr:50S ribosomal protein L20 [Phycisphaerae bacterium]